MEYIANMKLLSHDSFHTRMTARIKRQCEKSVDAIQSIPHTEGKRWTKELLLHQAELKRNDHLNAKDCELPAEFRPY
jgi:hypothetical protein